MPLTSRLSSLWRKLVHRDRVDRDLDDEVRAMFAWLVDEHTRAGMPPADARRAAMLKLGRVESLEDQVRDARTGAFMDVLLQDIRYAVRSLRRTPGFTLAAVLTLALGIGANTTIFTLLDAVILKPLPVPAARELVALRENAPEAIPDGAGGTGRYFRFSYPRFERLQQALGSQGSLAAVTRSTRLVVRLPGSAQATPVRGQLVSGSYFATLGVAAARGRTLDAGDVRLDQIDPVAVVSDGFWKRSLGGAETAVGQTLAVNGLAVTIVGVAPAGFVGTWTDAEAELWLPLTLQTALRYTNNASSYSSADRGRPWVGQDRIAWLNLIGRVRPADLPRVRSLLEASNRQGLTELANTFSDGQGRRDMLAHTLGVEPFVRGFSGLRARFSDGLFALSAMVAVVLLVTCANIANLMLARAAGRARDLGIRLSLGATSSRLIRQCLTESLVLALTGGAIGLSAGAWASGFLARQVLGTSGTLPAVFSPDARVLLFAAGLSLATAILFGLAPAVRATRAGRAVSLSMNQRQAVGQTSMRGMRPLVAAQLALSVVVVCAAVLLGRTLVNFTRLDPGFEIDHLVATTFDPAASGYSGDDVPALGRRVVDAVRRLPGVTSAAISACGLVDNCSSSSSFRIEGTQAGVSLQNNSVGPEYFATVGIPLVSGREFGERDTARSPRVAIITESIARRHFQGQSPLGRRLGFTQLDTEIVGVVREARSMSLRTPPVPMVYFPIDQDATSRTSSNNLDVRVAGDAGQAVVAVRSALRRTEPGLLLEAVATMRTRLTRDVARERIIAYLASGFALLALFLASLGLYGVLSYAVARRTQEIGVRMALGARSREVAGLVVRDALGVVGVGVLVGVGAAVGASRMLRSLLFDVSVSDPATGALVLAVLAAVTLAAAYLPARRATRVDPMTALRSE
jgi:predicted permease